MNIYAISKFLKEEKKILNIIHENIHYKSSSIQEKKKIRYIKYIFSHLKNAYLGTIFL